MKNRNTAGFFFFFLRVKAWSSIRSLKTEMVIKVLPEGWERKSSPKLNDCQVILTAPQKVRWLQSPCFYFLLCQPAGARAERQISALIPSQEASKCLKWVDSNIPWTLNEVTKHSTDADCVPSEYWLLLFIDFLSSKLRTVNLDSILKSRDITLPTKVRLVKAMFFQWSCMDVRVESNSL